jgi:hypothetical protein
MWSPQHLLSTVVVETPFARQARGGVGYAINNYACGC